MIWLILWAARKARNQNNTHRSGGRTSYDAGYDEDGDLYYDTYYYEDEELDLNGNGIPDIDELPSHDDESIW